METIEIRIKTDENDEPILDPAVLWAAFCEAIGLEDDSTGYGYDSYAFIARSKETGNVVSEIIIGR